MRAGIPQLIDDRNKKSSKCVVLCKAKSSLTGDMMLCGWGKSDDCYQAELGARKGCLMNYWKPPYVCGQ